MPPRSRLFAAVAAALLFVTGCSSAPAVPATGKTTEVTVTVQGMHYVPAEIGVPVGNALVITFENTGIDLHDLVVEGGVRSRHLAPGESQVLEVGVVGADLDGWCSIGNHRAQGMELVIRAIG